MPDLGNEDRWYHEPVLFVRDMVLEHDTRLDSLDLWRAELRGAIALMRLALGTSVLSAVVSLLAIAQMLSQKL